MDEIITLIGLVIGIVIFLYVMDKVTAIFYGCHSLIITFLFCWGVGIVLAWIAWKLAIIVGVIVLVMYVWKKIFGTKNVEQTKSSEEDSASTKEN